MSRRSSASASPSSGPPRRCAQSTSAGRSARSCSTCAPPSSRARYSRRVNEGNALKTLAGVRMAIGAGAWATPRLAGRLFGLDVAANPQAPYLARLFGARDLALAWGALGAEGSARRQWLAAGLACDAADALAGLAGGRGGYLPKPTTAPVRATALAGIAMGAVALRESQ